MTDLSWVMFWVFFAASAPFVISILLSLSANVSSETAADYFLYRRKLSVGDFIAMTIGYSLQVSSIFLFFYWGLQYGIWPIIMCLTWAGGYRVMAYLVKQGRLDDFLGLTTDEMPRKDRITPAATTIHGYVGNRISSLSNNKRLEARRLLLKHFAVLVLSLASVIGIAGTMMTEIDYSTQFLLQAVGMETSDSVVRYLTQVSMLLFTTFYVLWGGFKAAALTDRIQVPAAYVGLGVFTVGVSFYAQSYDLGIGVFYILLTLAGLYLILLLIRLSAVRERGDPWSRTTAYLTFGSLLLTTLVALYFLWPAETKGITVFLQLLFPPFPAHFVILGGTSLLVTNLLWQLIDISSLQRLQAINQQDMQKYRSEIVGVIRKTGAEAGLGWTLIILCALILKTLNLGEPDKLIQNLFQNLLTAPGLVPFLVPVFILTAVVFMLSTISGFISAVAYIAHFDIAPALGIYRADEERRPEDEIRITRLVTLTCVILIYLGYSGLRAASRGDISTMLYAIWSFQLAIAPAVVTSFYSKALLSPWTVAISTLSGMAIGAFAATHSSSTFGISIADEAWSMLPPLFVVLVSSIVFFALNFVLRPTAVADTPP
jgi:hypothetical protein